MEADAALTPRLRAEIERWFVRRGVPQLIEGYTTEQRMDARAAPYIVAWLVIGTVVWWGVNPERPPLVNALTALGTLVFIGLGFNLMRWLRGVRPWPMTPSVEMADVPVWGVLVGIAAGLVDGSVREAIVATLNSLLGIGAIYAVIALGVLEIGAWGIGRLANEMLRIFALVARTLPILLILVLFLLFASEIWEAAHELNAAELAAVLALVALVAVLLIVTALRAEMRTMDDRGWEALLADARETPAEPLTRSAHPAPPPPLTWLQRLNVTMLVVLSQLIQSVFVALMVTAFLVILGLLALPASLQERWVGNSIGVMAEFRLLAETRTLSDELVTVSALLGGVVGLYFTGLAVTDATYRTEHFSRVMDEVRQLLAARALYALAGRNASQAGASNFTG